MVLRFLKAGVDRVQSALTKTRQALGGKLRAILGRKMDDDAADALEELLYEADLGVNTAAELAEKIREASSQMEGEQLLEMVRQELLSKLATETSELNENTSGPTVIMVVGVNGSGKTTSTAKVTRLLQQQGKSVLLGACDTFRAAAADQLEMWAGRLKADIVKGHPRQDPSAVAYDTLCAAMARNNDIAILDTAGRLQSKTNLMQELDKMKRACHKALPNSPHEILLVLDASTGQNAIDQAKTFHQYTPLTGIILTKLDGTAKGGIVVAISQELGVPVKFIGTGESLDDLQPFDAKVFVDALI